MKTPTPQQLLSQIEGLQRTQAPEVWVRSDILLHFLGEEGKQFVLGEAAWRSKKPRSNNLFEEQKNMEKAHSYPLVCVKRAEYLQALLTAQASLPRKSHAVVKQEAKAIRKAEEEAKKDE